MDKNNYPAELNLSTFDEDDEEEIKRSYNNIRHKQNLVIVTEELEFQSVYKEIINSLHIPYTCKFSFQNLFRLTLPAGEFYIAQCLFDYGYPVLSKLQQSSEHKYHYQLIGFAKLTIDLGKTIMRPETKADKLMFKIFDKDIDFEGYDKFNYKYYLASNSKDQVYKAFTDKFLRTLAKYSNIILVTKTDAMFIGFEFEMRADHAAIVEDVFSNFGFIASRDGRN